MRYLVTAREIMERGKWVEFCEQNGINEYSVNEGLLDAEDEFTLTQEEAERLGLVNVRPE